MSNPRDTLHRALLWAPAALLLPGCFDIDCERLDATVTWSPQAETLAVDLVLVNFDLSMLQCDDVESCVTAAHRMVAPVDADPEADGFWPAGELAKDQATDITVNLERHGDLLDLRLRFTAPVNGDAVDPTDVYVLHEGKPGKEKAKLMVVLEEGDTVEPDKGRRFVYVDPRDGETVTFLVLKPRERTVTMSRPESEDVEPPLVAVPGLATALVEAGLISQ